MTIDQNKSGVFRVMLISDFPTQSDMEKGMVLADYAGVELTNMLAEAGIARDKCKLTTVLKTNPPKDAIENLCGNKKTADAEWELLGNKGKYPFTPIKPGKYLLPKYLGNMAALHKEIVEYDPNLIVTLGGFALWAVSGISKVSKMRGTLQYVEFAGGSRPYKILPTYAPSYAIANFEDRPIIVADFMKAEREAYTQTYERPRRELWLEPTIGEIDYFKDQILARADAFAVDIETARGQITCIGFGTATQAICIPFVDSRKPNYSYWSTLEEEVLVWNLVRKILELDVPKIFQNGMYDLQWLWKKVGITPKGELEDTMLLHHSMYPEMSKGLAFLGSIYTNEVAWKRLRPRSTKTQKKDDAE